MTAGFDNTMLSLLLNPNCNLPTDASGSVVPMAKERAAGAVTLLNKSRRRVIFPAPAIAELLTAIGPEARQYLEMVTSSRRVSVAPFDSKGAVELAILNRDIFSKHDKSSGAEPWQKVKFDRQIIAICRVEGVTELYTDDHNLGRRAVLCGIAAIRTADLPIPSADAQAVLPFDADDAPLEVPDVVDE